MGWTRVSHISLTNLTGEVTHFLSTSQRQFTAVRREVPRLSLLGGQIGYPELPVTYGIPGRRRTVVGSLLRGVGLALCRVDLGQELLDGDRCVRRAGRTEDVESVLG